MKNKHTALVCTLLLGLSACTQEHTATAAAAASAPAPAVLLESRYLESRLSGEASETESAQSAAFAELLAGGRADAFTALFAQARHPAGKAYALIGLHQTDPAAYARLKNDWPAAEEITVLAGDLAWDYRAAELFPAIEDGRLLRFISEPRPHGDADALLPPFADRQPENPNTP
jgi:lipoprotein